MCALSVMSQKQYRWHCLDHATSSKNSLSIQYIMPSEETADSVCVQYFSEKTWKASEIVGAFEGSSSDKTATVELLGRTNKDQAQREAVYMALANRYRRRIVTFSMELEGLMLWRFDCHNA